MRQVGRRMEAYDGANDIGAERPHCVDGIGCGAVLEDDLEVGELLNQVPERGEESGFGVHDGYTVGCVAGDFAV